MNKLFKSMILAVAALTAWPVTAAQNSTVRVLEIGVVPYMSARVLISSYEPMRLYLEQALDMPVKIYTANGFKQYFHNAQKGDYDLLITSAHFARILQKENQYTPLVRYSKGGRGLVVTALKGPLKTDQDLKGQTIAVPDQLSLASIVCMTWLQENGLHSGIDFKLLEVPSFESAILSIQKGDATAAVSAPAALAQMRNDLRESVNTIVDTGEYINLVFLTNPRMDIKQSALLNNALLTFGNETTEGKLFLNHTGFGSLIPATAKDMNSLDRYISETKRLVSK